jgi:hypothetical protein
MLLPTRPPEPATRATRLPRFAAAISDLLPYIYAGVALGCDHSHFE